MILESLLSAPFRSPEVGLLGRQASRIPSDVKLIQTDPLAPLLAGKFEQTGLSHWQLRDHNVNAGLGAVGHRFARGEALVFGRNVFTFPKPDQCVLLERPCPVEPVAPKDEVIFAAAATMNLSRSGLCLFGNGDLSTLREVLADTGSCIFVIQGVLNNLEVQCVQPAGPEHTDFASVPKLKGSFPNVVATIVGLYLEGVDPYTNVEGPHLQALVHQTVPQRSLPTTIKSTSFDSPRGGGHVTAASFREVYFWRQPTHSRDIQVLRP